MKRQELEINILDWAEERSLLNPENHVKQTLKTLSEAGELADAICEEDEPAIKDAIGDIEVCLTILKEQLGYRQNEPLNSAYNEIKDRTGETVNGTFIKD